MMVRGSSRVRRLAVSGFGALLVLTGLTTLGVQLANPSAAESPSYQVLPPTTTFNGPVAVSSDGTHVWVVNKGGNSVTELDASSGTTVQVISGSSFGFNQPTAVFSDGTHVWVANTWGNSVVELDASTGSLVRVIGGAPSTTPWNWPLSGEFDFPTGITSDGSHVWVLSNNYYQNDWLYTELDASTGALLKEIQGPTGVDQGPYMGIADDGTHVWITNSGYWVGPIDDESRVPGFLTELDAASGATLNVMPETNFGAEFSPDAVSADRTHVWVGNSGTDSVAELDAATGALLQVISLTAYGNMAEFISSDGTHVWVKSWEGLVELDASSGAVVGTVSDPDQETYQDFQEVASDGTHVWDVHPNTQGVTEVDASTGAIDQVIPANSYGLVIPMATASDGTHVWVANDNNTLSELDASTGALIQVVSGPSYGFGFGLYTDGSGMIADDGVHVWVANTNNNSVTELEASTGALVQVISGPSYDFENPWNLSSDGTHVWVTSHGVSSTNPINYITELDASTGGLVQVISGSKYGFVNPSSIASDGSHVWVSNGSTLVGTTWTQPDMTELSATTGAFVKVISGVALAFDIAADGTHVWVSNSTSDTELNASTGAVVQTVSPPGQQFAESIASDGTHVWVASSDDNEVIELDASTGAVVQTLSDPAYGLDWPSGIRTDGSNVWVTNEHGNSVTELSTGIMVQRIVFTSSPPPTPLVGGSYSVSASGGASGNPVTFSIDPAATSVCSVSGQTVTFNAPGTCTVDADQAAGNGYPAATEVQQSFVVGAQVITFTSQPPASATVGGPQYVVSAGGGGSGNPVTFSIDPAATSVCSISGSVVTMTGAGTCTIDANQAGGNGFVAAPASYQSFVVGAQTVTFTSYEPFDPPVGSSYEVSATGGGSGNPVTFSSDDPTVCTVSGSLVTFIGNGWCDIMASQAGNANYLAAQPAFQSFIVGAGPGGFGVSSSSLPNASVNRAYKRVGLQAAGAPTPYTWRISTGALPRGMKLSTRGVISGRPGRGDTVGTYTFSVEASTRKPHSPETTPQQQVTITLQR